MKTFSLKAQQVKKRWVVINADGAVVGRLAAFIATILRGKNKPEYTPHMDCGDNVIVINAEKVKFTGNKLKNKIYYRHTGYPGGLKSCTPAELSKSGRFDRVLKMAVARMIGDGPMARSRFKNLYVYCGPVHKHCAQKPIELNFLQMNVKNKVEV
ncbi:50S ribosomal protein L13 [Candidatus Neoehrlichia procyonis]|uniref:Large ribosomal subunit protein uL13 n=1 Tax=Candidatus Neoehrlichia procyonis str. RAC413 TaxID=1359163 RepID=A0A0F3NN64_9RICK|nr:50S ribosomal protein L13 [Candidatus Neoehrlichia lotoris]KJV69508.1 ribosomal protein L13 [Candidatus Neoehrlichia lotoris str. RAC413]